MQYSPGAASPVIPCPKSSSPELCSTAVQYDPARSAGHEERSPLGGGRSSRSEHATQHTREPEKLVAKAPEKLETRRELERDESTYSKELPDDDRKMQIGDMAGAASPAIAGDWCQGPRETLCSEGLPAMNLCPPQAYQVRQITDTSVQPAGWGTIPPAAAPRDQAVSVVPTHRSIEKKSQREARVAESAADFSVPRQGGLAQDPTGESRMTNDRSGCLDVHADPLDASCSLHGLHTPL